MTRTGPLQRRAADAFSPALVAQLTAVEEAFGGRDELIAVLACAPRSQDLDYLLGLVADPDRQHLPLADLCAAADLRPSELFAHLKAGNTNRATALATRFYPTHLPSVVEDIFVRAQPHIIQCRTCRGKTTVTRISPNGTDIEVPCGTCGSLGTETVDGDLSRAQVALKLTGMLSEGPAGANVTLNQQINAGHGGVGGGILQTIQADAARALRKFEEEPLPDLPPSDTVAEGVVEEPQ